MPNQLDVFYIDFRKPSQENGDSENSENHSPLQKIVQAPKKLANTIKGKIAEGKKPNGLNSIQVISSPEQLSFFRNAHNQKWMTHRDDKDKIQYYVRHPKLNMSNQLILAEEFNKYIFDEYVSELINFCRSHVKAKSIKIYSYSSALKSVGDFGLGGGMVIGNTKSELLNISSPHGLKPENPLPNYNWLENKIMQSIDGLTDKGSFKFEQEHDFSFGADSDFLRYIGANTKYARKYVFKISIKC